MKKFLGILLLFVFCFSSLTFIKNTRFISNYNTKYTSIMDEWEDTLVKHKARFQWISDDCFYDKTTKIVYSANILGKSYPYFGINDRLCVYSEKYGVIYEMPAKIIPIEDFLNEIEGGGNIVEFSNS